MAKGVSAIVVNWNGAADLDLCLESLKAQTGVTLQIVVVDNASSDKSREVAQAYGVDWVQMDCNTGLAPAMNIGADHAQFPLLLFLNNDMKFEPNFVSELVASHERNPSAAAIDALQRDWTSGEVVHAGTTLERQWLRGDLPGWRLRLTVVDRDAPTLYPSGANTLIARDLFDSIGRWDDRFFAGWEDVDLGWRLWMSGHAVLVAPAAIALHRVGGSSSGEGAAIRSEAAIHGRLLFSLKHAPVATACFAAGRFAFASAWALVRLDRSAIKMRVRVLRRLRHEAPAALAWRRRTYRANGTTPRRLWRDMRHR